jgi:peptide chain release factor subunit 1
MTNPAKDIAKQTTETTQPQRLLDKLLKFEPASSPVISLYVDARVDEHGKRTFQPFVRKQLGERAKSYEARTPERESFDKDSERIMAYLENGIVPSINGLAIFACTGANDFFEVGTFEAPFERNRLLVSDRPHLYPLARLIDQYRRYAVVLADRNRAQIFVFASGRAEKERSVENVKTKHTSVGGWSQSRYQRHEENYHLQHVKEVVDRLERTVKGDNIEHVILAGDEETVIPLLREQLSQELSEKVIDALSLGIDTPEHELLEETLKAFKVHDSLTDMQKVERLLNEYRADDLGVAGVPETLAALSNGQVEEMLIVSSAEKLQYDKKEVEKVLRLYDTDGQLPTELDQRTVADELVRRANLLSSARVTFIEDDTRMEQLGGVGAFLRYRISEENAAPYEDSSSTPRSKALTTKA